MMYVTAHSTCTGNPPPKKKNERALLGTLQLKPASKTNLSLHISHAVNHFAAFLPHWLQLVGNKIWNTMWRERVRERLRWRKSKLCWWWGVKQMRWETWMWTYAALHSIWDMNASMSSNKSIFWGGKLTDKVSITSFAAKQLQLLHLHNSMKCQWEMNKNKNVRRKTQLYKTLLKITFKVKIFIWRCIWQTHVPLELKKTLYLNIRRYKQGASRGPQGTSQLCWHTQIPTQTTTHTFRNCLETSAYATLYALNFKQCY